MYTNEEIQTRAGQRLASFASRHFLWKCKAQPTQNQLLVFFLISEMDSTIYQSPQPETGSYPCHLPSTQIQSIIESCQVSFLHVSSSPAPATAPSLPPSHSWAVASLPHSSPWACSWHGPHPHSHPTLTFCRGNLPCSNPKMNVLT